MLLKDASAFWVYSALGYIKKFQASSVLNWILKFCISCDNVYFYRCLLTGLVHLVYMSLPQKFYQISSSCVFRFLPELSKIEVYFEFSVIVDNI